MRRLALLLTMLCGAVFGFATAHGQEYGVPLDESEQMAMTETFQYALENNKTNEAAAWVNPDTGRTGTLVPLRTYQNDAGQYCREYVTTIIIGGEEQQGYGTACRQPDGTWQIVSEGIPAEYQTVVEKNYYAYPYGYPDWYNRYPYYAWDYYYPRIFFSFDIVHFSGHRHFHGHHFHGTKLFHGREHFHDTRRFHGRRQPPGVQHFQGINKFRGAQQFQGVRKFEGTQQFQGIKQRHDRRPGLDGTTGIERSHPFRGGQHGKGFKGGSRFDGNRKFDGDGGRRSGRR